MYIAFRSHIFIGMGCVCSFMYILTIETLYCIIIDSF